MKREMVMGPWSLFRKALRKFEAMYVKILYQFLRNFQMQVENMIKINVVMFFDLSNTISSFRSEKYSYQSR